MLQSSPLRTNGDDTTATITTTSSSSKEANYGSNDAMENDSSFQAKDNNTSVTFVKAMMTTTATVAMTPPPQQRIHPFQVNKGDTIYTIIIILPFSNMKIANYPPLLKLKKKCNPLFSNPKKKQYHPKLGHTKKNATQIQETKPNQN